MRAIRALALAAVAILPVAVHAQNPLAGFPLGARIPEISGHVVDALTDKPVANIDVTLRATSLTASFGDGGEDALRYENAVTPEDGSFRFRTSLESAVASPLTRMEGYWLTVNRTFRPRSKENNGFDDSDPTRNDFSWELAADPLFNRKRFALHGHGAGPPLVNNRAYFPIAIQFVCPCKQTWNANCINLAKTKNVRVPLIPVLDDPATCRAIRDSTVREHCRQLNTYRAAFLHVETIAEVRADKELCGEVDQGPGTKFCLETLQGYIQNSSAFENRAPLRMEIDPIDKVLILAPIAGLTVSRTYLSSVNPFWETARYLACYSAKRSPLESVCANVLWSGTNEGRRFDVTMGGEGAPENVMVDGNSIRVRDSRKEYSALWVSGPRVVRLTFYHTAYWHSDSPTAQKTDFQEASPEMRQEFIREYLAKYPSAH